MATVEELRLAIKAEVGDAVAKLNQYRKTAKDTGTQTATLGKTFASLRDVMQGPVAAARQVITAFKQIKAVSDAMEAAWSTQEEAVALLNSTLRATGNIAGFTSQELQDMASGFQKVTKYGDETVMSMQSVLLGFKNIRGDNFKEASLQILNMATVMKMDLTAATQAVGKALDNPILGLDSLSRQGFKFTEQEKEMIKVLVEAGKLQEAQGIILKELATTFGGAAEAAGETGSAIKVRLGNAIGDMNEQIGRAISDRLKPWRLAWLNMAEAIGAAAKAQNDFRDAMGRMGSGTASTADRLIVESEVLSNLVAAYADAEKQSRSIVSEGELATMKEALESQQRLVRALSEQKKEEARLSKATTEAEKRAAAASAEAAKKWAENELRYIEGRKLVVDILSDETTGIRAQIKLLESIPWAPGQLELERLAALEALYDKLFGIMKTGPDESIIKKPLRDIEIMLNALSAIEPDTPSMVIIGNKELTQIRQATAAISMEMLTVDDLYDSVKAAQLGINGLTLRLDDAKNMANTSESAFRGLNAVMTQFDPDILATNAYVPDMSAIKSALDYVEYFQDAMSGYLTSSFDAFGSALAQGEDAWVAWGDAGTKAIAGIIKQIGAMTIAKGVANLFNPFTAVQGLGQIAAGATLSTLGGAMGSVPKPTGAGSAGMTTIVNNHYNVGGSVVTERQIANMSAKRMARAGRGY